MTNADYIRSLDNEHLAAFLGEITHGAVYRGYKLKCDKDKAYWAEARAKNLEEFVKWVNEECGRRTVA